MTSHLSPIDEAILLATAWTAPITTPQLVQLLHPCIRRSALHVRLQRLAQHGLIARTRSYRARPGRPPLSVGNV